MLDKIGNLFIEDKDAKSTLVPSSRTDVNEYYVLKGGNGAPLRVLFLSSDSIDKAKSFIAEESRQYSKGLITRHKRNVEEVRAASADEHLIASFVESYKAGGERALAGVLAIAEEEHVIQAAVDVNEKAYFDKHFNVRISEVPNRIRVAKPDIVHFSGHIKKDAGLVFACRDENSLIGFKNEYLDRIALKKCFCRTPAKLVVLLSCNSAEYAKFLVESGVARMAIGTDSKIYDDCALRFVENFYGELAKKSGMTNDNFDDQVKNAYVFAIQSEKKRSCPMHIYPEIKSYTSSTKAIDNTIAVDENCLKNPVTEAKLKNDYV